MADVERLGQIVEGAPLGRPDRGEQGVLGAHHDHRQGRPAVRIRGSRSSVFSSGRATSMIATSPVAGLDPAPQRPRLAGRLYLVALARDSARLTTRPDPASSSARSTFWLAHATPTANPVPLPAGGGQPHPEKGAAACRAVGDDAAVVGRRSWPPATGPGRCRLRLVLTNGSNRWSTMSNGTPRPLSRTSTVIGSSRRVAAVAHGDPEAVLVLGGQCDRAVWRLGAASAAFLTRFRNTCTSRSRSPSTSGREGS